MTSDDLAQRLAATEEEVQRLRELVVRAYEDTPRAAAQLLRLRRQADYMRAYSGEPLVSIRIGAYLGGDLLIDRALASVRAQTYANWEAIVVCDGRDAETAERIAALGDERLRCVQRPRNGPYPAAAEDRWHVAGTHPFNLGVALSRGAWIAPIDQDDEWERDHLEALLEGAFRSGAELVYGVGRVLLEDGTETYFGAWPPVLGDFGFQTALYHGGLAPMLYDANSYLVGEPADWNLARRMLEAGVSFEFVERPVTAYYVNRDEASFGGWKGRQEQRGPYVSAGG